MTGGTARRAAAIGRRSEGQTGVRLGVRPRRAAGTAVLEGRPVAGLNGGVVATIVVIAGSVAVIAARGRTGAGVRERSSREPPIGKLASRGSTGMSGRRSRRRIG